MADPKVQILGVPGFAMIDGFVMDVSLSEQHKFEADVTEYPVESGGSVSDNIRPKPLEVSLECIVSDTPIGAIATRRGLQQGQFNLGSYASDAYEHLKRVYNNREPVVIVTSLETFSDMALKSLSVPRATGRGKELRFTAEFVQIQFRQNTRRRVLAEAGGGGNGRAGLGANPAKIIETRRVLWRHGTPPGFNGTVDAHLVVTFGKFVRTEFVLVESTDETDESGKITRYFHELQIVVPAETGSTSVHILRGTELTESERLAFFKDLKRDQEQKTGNQAGKFDKAIAASQVGKPVIPSKNAPYIPHSKVPK